MVSRVGTGVDQWNLSLTGATNMALLGAEDMGIHHARTPQAGRERFHAALAEVKRVGFDDRSSRVDAPQGVFRDQPLT